MVVRENPDRKKKSTLEIYYEGSNINAQHYYNKGQKVKSVNLQIGDKVIALVIVRQDKINKFTPLFDPRPYRLIKIRGSMITASQEGGGKEIIRNISFMKYLKNSFFENNYLILKLITISMSDQDKT